MIEPILPRMTLALIFYLCSESESEIVKSCPTLCDPMGCSILSSSIHGIFQARVLSGVPFPSPVDLSNPGIEPGSPALQADALPSEPAGKPGENLLANSVILKSKLWEWV